MPQIKSKPVTDISEIILHNIKIPVDSSSPENEAIEKALHILKKENIKTDEKSISIAKKSIDARKKDSIYYVFSVTAEIFGRPKAKSLEKIGAVILQNNDIKIEYGNEHLNARPVIVGFGPCGIFCALLLAENGYRPIVIERGENVYSRRKSVERFYKERILNPESNIQFGAGGAGTFSDGKLMTRINDSKCSYVINRFVELGAPEEIRIQAKPHIGTDLLLGVVDNALKKIESCGGNVYFDTKLEDVKCKSDGSIYGIKTNRGEIDCDLLVMAIGHSSRDTYKMLERKSFEIYPKSFSVGVRIEHLQEKINNALYGRYADILPPAEYSLSKRVGERGVYSFCMCPGGEVVAAASEIGGVVTNGMSKHARDGVNANSALAVSVFPADYGEDVDSAVDFCRKIENKAFLLGGKNYNAPMQTVGDFLSKRSTKSIGDVKPTYMGGDRVTPCDLHELFPNFVSSMLEVGIADFAKKIDGFDCEDAILTGPETRTSAPIRILRTDEMTAVGHVGIYPCGEGAGYAGGITSAAVDGVNCALRIMKKYDLPR